MNRRKFIQLIFSIPLLTQPLFGYSIFTTKIKYLTFKNIHTKEELDIVIFQNGEYQLKAFKLINYIMRDFRQKEMVNIDPELIVNIYNVLNDMGLSHKTINLHSGYRSKKTNNLLSKQGLGVAKNSYHTKGQAIDLSIDGVKLSSLRNKFVKKAFGGVGYYPKSGFIHLDTGNVRNWIA